MRYMTYTRFVRTKEKECHSAQRVASLFFLIFFFFFISNSPLLFSPPPLPFISHFSLSLLPPFLPAYLPPSLKILLSFHLSFFLRARSVAHVLRARSRAYSRDLSLSLKECERDSRRKKRGGRAMEESKKNAPVEQLLHDSHECRYVCVYERAGA